MAIQERVTDYAISQFNNDVVDYNQVVRLTTETGHQAFIAFPEQPPAQWLTVSGPNSTAYLEQGEFDRIHHLLQTESPVFLTSINLFGIRAFNLSTGVELPGEGTADDDALVQFMAELRRRLPDQPNSNSITSAPSRTTP
jgi:hypothetical protein